MEKNIHENPRFAISETPKIFLPIIKDIFKREGIQEDKKRLVFETNQKKFKKSLSSEEREFSPKEYDPNILWINIVLLNEFKLYPKETIDKINEIRLLRNGLEHKPEIRNKYTRFELEKFALEYSDFIYDFILDYYQKYILPLDIDEEPEKNIECILIKENALNNENTIFDESKCETFYSCEFKEYVNKLIRNINAFNEFKEEFDLKNINTPDDLDKSIEYLKIFLNKPKYVNNEKHLLSSIRSINSFQNIHSGNIDNAFYEFSLIRQEFMDVSENKVLNYHLNKFKDIIGELTTLFNKISFFYKCQNINNFSAVDIYIENLQLLEFKPKYIEDTDEIKLLLEIIQDQKDGNPIYAYNILEIRESVKNFDKKLDDSLIKRDIFDDLFLDNLLKQYQESESFLESPLAKRLDEVPDIRGKINFYKNKMNRLLKSNEYKEIESIFKDIFGKGFLISDIEEALNRLESCRMDVNVIKKSIKKYAKYDLNEEVLLKEAISINNYNNGYVYYSKILKNLDISKTKLAKYNNWEENSKKLDAIFGNVYSGFKSDMNLLNRQFDINKKYSDLVKMGFFKENITDYVEKDKLNEDISKLMYYKKEIKYLIEDINKNFYTKGTIFYKENVYNEDFDDLLFVIYKAMYNYEAIDNLKMKKAVLNEEDKYSDFYYETLISNLRKFILEIDKLLSILELNYIGLFIKHINTTKKHLLQIKDFFLNYIDSTNIKEKIDNDVIARRFFEDKWNGAHSNTNELSRYLERSKSFTDLIDDGTFSKKTEQTIHNYTVEELMEKLNNLSRLKKVFKDDTFIEFLLNTSSSEISEADFNTIKDALEEFDRNCSKINGR